MREWLRRRPWIWVILLFLAVLGVHVAVYLIAESQPPVAAG
jgi:hypothetical protein